MTPTLIVTRPAPQGTVFADAVQQRWARPLEVVLSPLLRIVPIALPPDIGAAQGLILTSVNGVAAAARAGLPQGLTAWCVGDKTAEAAQEAGFHAVPGPGDAEGLIDMLIAQRPMGKLVHLRGCHSRGDIAVRLAGAGLECAEVIAYEQEAVALTEAARHALRPGQHVIFPLFSARTARILVESGPYDSSVDVVAISPAVESASVALGARCVVVADRPDQAAMVDATIGCLNALSSRLT